MPLIKWRDSFSVGAPKFDEEHKVLLAILNEMFVIVRDEKGPSHLNDEVDKLIQYTEKHFASEEAVMEAIGYPALEKHKAIHAKLVEEVIHFKKQVDNGEEQATTFYHFLRDWLLTHIVEEDMLYKPFLADSKE